eukprot:5022057-Lingulodinium_polyedra.AAC.1
MRVQIMKWDKPKFKLNMTVFIEGKRKVCDELSDEPWMQKVKLLRKIKLKYRDLSFSMRVKSLEQQFDVIFAAHFKGRLAEAGLLKPLFAESAMMGEADEKLREKLPDVHDCWQSKWKEALCQ